MTERLARDQAYMEIAGIFSKRSTCLRGHVGCVAVRDNHIICAGYNGAPKGMPHCLEVGCGGGMKMWQGKDECGTDMGWGEEFPNGCTRSIHAEQNMVAYAARIGVSLGGCTVYATHGPCLPCAQAMIGAGMAKLVYETPYRLPNGLELVNQANVEVVKWAT